MAEFVFTIPTNRSELLNEVTSTYTVKDVVIPNEIVPKLQEAQQAFCEEGPSFILDNFDTYYSVLHNANKIRPDVIYTAYNHLSKAVKNLNNSIVFLMDDKDSLNEEIQSKMVNVLKMLLYIYIQFIFYMEEMKKKIQDDVIVKSKKEKTNSNSAVNKSEVLSAINSIIQLEINLLWQPPIVEHDFVGLLGELCFVFLQNPTIQREQEIVMEIFGLFGNLIKSYDYGEIFVSRMIGTIRMYEHVAHCVSDGIKLLVQQFSCEKLIHHFIKEATEWQIHETFQDTQGSRFCSVFLTELAVAVPDLILPEVIYLNRYLAHESIPLRNAVLNIMNEIVLQVLTNHDLSEENKELRDDILDVIIEHLCDVSAVVRSKVIQNLSKLQKENAIPLSFQNDVLSKVIKHLYDKAAAVRKTAINSVTIFLEHNPYGAHLQLKKAEEQLAQKIELLNKIEASYNEAYLVKIKQVEKEWLEISEQIKQVVKTQLGRANNEELNDKTNVDKDQVFEEIRTFLNDKKFVEAVHLCQILKDSTEEFKNMRNLSEDHEVELYVTILRSIFINETRIMEELRTGVAKTDEDISKIQALENIIKYFENTINFLKIINSAIEPMKSLLFSQTFTDTQEAIQFFVRAFQFKIDEANEGILEMLKIMRCSEQERRNSVIDAFKIMYLTTDAKNMKEHTTIILDRLISLLKDITFENLEDFQNIVTEWTAKGLLDNSVIDRCWQYYTQKEPVSNDDARAAAEILRMTALGRPTIITKNIYVVSTIVFSQQHKNDMIFLASSCRLLSTAGGEKIDVQSANPPFRIKCSDPIFKNLAEIIVDNFFEKHPYYTEAMQASLDFIFRVCSKPNDIVEKILGQISEKFNSSSKTLLLTIRLCELLGCIAVKLLGYLDNSVYRELKRRTFLREERKTQNKNKSKKNKKETIPDRSDASINESVLMGAEAEDADAEFILSVLENDVVSTKGLLGQYSSFILNICQRPDSYSNLLLQQAAVTALMRYMLVSSKFCSANIRLLFTILEKTTYPQLKCTIVIHCADLLTRFPNIVEPWSPRLYAMLKDPLVEVRKKAFFALANLILKSMIRAHSHISDMAVCLIDQDESVSGMCKSFFERMQQKDNNLVNIIPDIFTHIVRNEQISDEDLKNILKFMFDLVDTSKRMENLVDRFCSKYTPDENFRLNRNITFCLSLINYNDKALRKLREKFSTYQHHLHDSEIYSTFKQILAECNKTKPGRIDLKTIVTELENCIASIFEVDENGEAIKPPSLLKNNKTKTTNRSRKKTKKQTSDSDSDVSDEGTPKNIRSKSKRTFSR